MSIWVAAGRMSSSSQVMPSDSIRWMALLFVPALVANPGIVKPRMWVRGRPSRSQALAATISAWVESRPPETPMTIVGIRAGSPPPIARIRCSSPETWML